MSGLLFYNMTEGLSVMGTWWPEPRRFLQEAGLAITQALRRAQGCPGEGKSGVPRTERAGRGSGSRTACRRGGCPACDHRERRISRAEPGRVNVTDATDPTLATGGTLDPTLFRDFQMLVAIL